MIPASIVAASETPAKPARENISHYERRCLAREAVLQLGDISKGARIVYLLLDDIARGKDTCDPSQKYIASKLEISVPTVERQLRELVKAGLLTVRRTAPGAGNEYTLAVRNSEVVKPNVISPPIKMMAPSHQNDGTLPSKLMAPAIKTDGSRARVLNTLINTEIEEDSLSRELEVFGQREEIGAAFDIHLKHRNGEGRDTVLLTAMALARQGKFDWAKLRERHAGYAAYWDRHGWNFCPLSFLGWIRAGMPPAPAEIVSGANGARESATERAIRVGYERIAKDGHL